MLELVLAVEGGVFWYDATVGDSTYDPWFSNTIIQDNPADTTDPNAAPTSSKRPEEAKRLMTFRLRWALIERLELSERYVSSTQAP